MSEIKVTKKNRVSRIQIDRPAKKNALTVAMYENLTQALQDAEKDKDVRLHFVEGLDNIFTAGNDLVDFAQNPPTGPDSPVLHFLAALVDLEKPIVAKVKGAAIGVGTTMLLHMDLIYVDTSAKFKMPFVPLGLCPEAASSYFLPRAGGFAQASDMLFFGESFDAETALRRGIVTEVLAPAELDARVENRLETLAALPPASLRASKALIRGPYKERTKAIIAAEGEVFIQRLVSEEAQEAFAAFAEKRKPDFSRF